MLLDYEIILFKLKDFFIRKKCVNTLSTNFSVINGAILPLLKKLEYSLLKIDISEYDFECDYSDDVAEIITENSTSILEIYFPFSKEKERVKCIKSLKKELDDLLTEMFVDDIYSDL